MTISPDREALEIEKLRLEIATQRIAFRDSRDKRRDAIASEWTARTYHFNGGVDERSVAMCMDALSRWQRIAPGGEIEVIFNSPGGYIFSGFALYDYLLRIRSEGIPLRTTCAGYAASMASILLQAGDERSITPNSYVMIHEASSDAWGKTSDIRDAVDLLDELEQKTYEILADRSKWTAKKIKERCARKDWWLTADEALSLGFVDEIR